MYKLEEEASSKFETTSILHRGNIKKKSRYRKISILIFIFLISLIILMLVYFPTIPVISTNMQLVYPYNLIFFFSVIVILLIFSYHPFLPRKVRLFNSDSEELSYYAYNAYKLRHNKTLSLEMISKAIEKYRSIKGEYADLPYSERLSDDLNFIETVLCGAFDNIKKGNLVNLNALAAFSYLLSNEGLFSSASVRNVISPPGGISSPGLEKEIRRIQIVFKGGKNFSEIDNEIKTILGKGKLLERIKGRIPRISIPMEHSLLGPLIIFIVYFSLFAVPNYKFHFADTTTIFYISATLTLASVGLSRRNIPK